MFNCFKWISAEKGDGKIERELPVCDTTPSFSTVCTYFLRYIISKLCIVHVFFYITIVHVFVHFQVQFNGL